MRKEYLEALEKELNLLQQQKNNLLHKQARAKTDNEIKYWQFRIDKFKEKISAFTNIKQRLESIDNANPSEALEYLERIRDILQNDRCIDIEWVFKHEYNTIKQALLKAQEQEKIIDTIKKHFNIKFDELVEKNGELWACLVSIQSKEDEGDYDTTACANLVDYKEEFDLLKETFKI